MGKAYSGDLRDRIAAQVTAGASRRAAGRRYGVSASTAVRVAQRQERTGSTAPDPQGRPVGSGKLAPHVADLVRWVEAEPDMTMPELATKLKVETGVEAHPASLSRVLLQAGLTVKKNAAGQRMRAR